ncbi:hypothetical protein BJX99DRAFT_218140 [Aspergillus californicus]
MTPDPQSKFRPRRRHRKSRNGCVECKRRRIKCDEKKPSCSRCILTMQPCIWPGSSQGQSASGEEGEGTSSQSELRLPSPSNSSPSGFFFDVPTSSTIPPVPEGKFGLSDADLYHHYLQHTSRTLSHIPQDQRALQIGIPTLALRSRTVFHALLAVSAASMCCEMITRDPPPDVGAVSQVMMTGYRHYNLSSERIRDLISNPNALRAEPLLAASPLLVPFATSSQQINHWISSRTRTGQMYKPLSTTPRDITVILRGIKTTLQALESSEIIPSPSSSFANLDIGDSDAMDDCPILTLEPGVLPAPSPPSRNHPMFTIVAETSQRAFSKLQDRLQSAFLYTEDTEALTACAAAFDVLSNLRTNTFTPTTSNPSPLPDPKRISIPHVTPWLRAFASRPAIPTPNDPLTRPFLSFLVQTPLAYIDLVLPLLDQRLEDPLDKNSRNPLELSQEQALALDIYAHWSVFMFLVEEESWFIGRLPNITLTGMLNRYGNDFVGRLWPGFHGQGQEEWWPNSMLSILREIGRCR